MLTPIQLSPVFVCFLSWTCIYSDAERLFHNRDRSDLQSLNPHREAPPITDAHAAQVFLSRYGFLNPLNLEEIPLEDPDETHFSFLDQELFSLEESDSTPRSEADEPQFISALKAFQQLSGIPVTGLFDQATREAMNKPRCGVADVETEAAAGGESENSDDENMYLDTTLERVSADNRARNSSKYLNFEDNLDPRASNTSSDVLQNNSTHIKALKNNNDVLTDDFESQGQSSKDNGLNLNHTDGNFKGFSNQTNFDPVGNINTLFDDLPDNSTAKANSDLTFDDFNEGSSSEWLGGYVNETNFNITDFFDPIENRSASVSAQLDKATAENQKNVTFEKILSDLMNVTDPESDLKPFDPPVNSTSVDLVQVKPYINVNNSLESDSVNLNEYFNDFFNQSKTNLSNNSVSVMNKTSLSVLRGMIMKKMGIKNKRTKDTSSSSTEDDLLDFNNTHKGFKDFSNQTNLTFPDHSDSTVSGSSIDNSEIDKTAFQIKKNATYNDFNKTFERQTDNDLTINSSKDNSIHFKDAQSKFKDFSKQTNSTFPDSLEPVGNSTLQINGSDRSAAETRVPAQPRRRGRRDVGGHVAFSKAVLRWRLIGEGYSSQLSVEEQRFVFRTAFRMWSEVSPLEFLEDTGSALEEVDIRLGFGTGRHLGCQQRFDGSGREFAHAWVLGDIHFDDDEHFTGPSAGSGISLLKVAVHEIGHVLGLPHIHRPGSVMQPSYLPHESGFEMDRLDRRAIQSLYGRCRGSFSTVFDWIRRERAPSGETVVRFNTYFMRDGWYWLYENRNNRTRYGDPVSLQSGWRGLPAGGVDAFVHVWGRHKDYRYFFKGSQFWRYDSERDQVWAQDQGQDRGQDQDQGQDRGQDQGQGGLSYPRPVSEGFPGVPSPIDTAVYDRRDRNIYFFRNAQVYAFSTELNRVVRGFPKSLGALFPAVVPGDHPHSNLDAAYFSYSHNALFLLKGTRFWRAVNDRDRRRRPALPRNGLLPHGEVAQQWHDLCDVHPSALRLGP